MTSKTDNFTQLTDEMLVRMASNGSTEAENCLIERYRDSVKISAASFRASYISVYSLSSLEPDDLFQEGLMGLMSAIYTFSEDKNTSFRTYAQRCISNRMHTSLRYCMRKKNVPPGGIVSLDDIELPTDISPEEKLISREETEDIYNFLNRELSTLELDVIRLYLCGESYDSIAGKLGTSEKSVDNAIQRVRNKLRGYLSKERS